MIEPLRQQFNARYRPEQHRCMLDRIARESGTPVAFRLSETPCFFPGELLERMARYGVEMLEQLADDAAYLARARAAIPAAYRVPNETPKPLFAQVDYGLIRDDIHTQKKTLKKSAYWYRKLSDTNELDAD